MPAQPNGRDIDRHPLRALWEYRGFVVGNTIRELRSRYLKSYFGFLWAIFNPAATILLFALIFGGVMRARLPGTDDGWAYALYLCAGILPWSAFVDLLSRCHSIFLESANLLKHASFPRITLPVTLFITTSVGFAITAALLALFLLLLGRFPGPVFLWIVPLYLVQQCLALGIGILLATLHVFFRDIGQMLGIGIQLWFWLTPIVYHESLLPEGVRWMLRLNPLFPVIQGYQNVIIEGAAPSVWGILMAAAASAVALAVGLATLNHLADEMLDEL